MPNYMRMPVAILMLYNHDTMNTYFVDSIHWHYQAREWMNAQCAITITSLSANNPFLLACNAFDSNMSVHMQASKGEL